MPTTSSTLPIIEDQKQSRRLGSLCVNKKEGQIALPLAAVDIQAQVVSRVASVTVKQTFNNPYSDFLEAVYIFPLSGGVAVNKFEMKVGDRIIHGKVEEREEARLQYAQAIAGGQRAALMEQEREDVFTVSVGNLPPGEKVEITIVYAERLPYFHEGKTELRLPLVIGHRYIPGTPVNDAPVGMGIAEDTDLVPDASRITPPRLVPGVKADLALSLQVEVATDQEEISDLSCSQHATSTSIKSGWITVTLSREDEVMDRDFVLGWRMATNQISSRLHTFKSNVDRSSMYGMLTVLPPKVDGFAGTARDVVFVVDRSGSMRGVKMSSAIRACSILLETLSPRDRFAVLAFDDRLEWMDGGGQTGKLYDADEDGLERGH
ncbi:MAG TPA: VIT domain-containing protein, partial [Trichormus sp.]